MLHFWFKNAASKRISNSVKKLVTWWLSRSRFLRKIKRNRYRNFFEQVWLDSNTESPYRDRLCLQLRIFGQKNEIKIAPQRDRRSEQVAEWVLQPSESNHAKRGGVCISTNPIMLSAEKFISSTLNIGAKKSKSNWHQIHKNRIKIESRGKTAIAHH